MTVLLSSSGTPVAGDIVVDLRVKLKAIEGDPLATDGDFREVWANVGIEPVAVHAEVAWSVTETDQTGHDARRKGLSGTHDTLGDNFVSRRRWRDYDCCGQSQR